ncbi:hypothetical protein Ahy_B03g067346 [Arachis hypogaea]|uniref:Uncharacterized protein n=1 Tax=Arachis hypogaea TaxID=3818 RepID=A0A445A6I8_ARAHY|nr:hypothetical protein Ahy_B03g067346 [Arachis hypogaea]
MNQEDERLRNVENKMYFERDNLRIVHRDQNADNVLARMRINQRSERYQVTRIVEDVLSRVGFNVDFMNQLYFISAFLAAVQAAEVPRGVKNHKIVTKYAGEVGESITEHIAQYIVELENLANDEKLKMKFSPSYLTKNAFT